MTRLLINPLILVSVIGLVLVLLGYLFDGINRCRRFAPLCRFVCLGVILGCISGLLGEFAYDLIERWLFRNVPGPAVTRFIDGVFDGGYARYLGALSGAAAAIWFWCIRPKKFPDSYP